MLANKDHWLVRETLGLMRRTFARLDVSSRSLFALIEPGSCFAGCAAGAGAGAGAAGAGALSRTPPSTGLPGR